ncbi:MAG: hypothetical protein JO170_15625, partial [Verrucomicrobia bacterium]|nr:hypothetical protein [Verrucomicrobiota bacterium]
MESRYFRKQITTAMMAGGASFIIWSPAVFASVADDFRFESGTFMQKTLYRRPEHVATDIDQSGAESPINITWNQTHTGKWYIEQQRYGGDAVCAGVAKQDTATIERGLKILHWGLE